MTERTWATVLVQSCDGQSRTARVRSPSLAASTAGPDAFALTSNP
ncbi:hypothetical protein [Planotetraspora silvatica]|nr:hypothetical protein [Planotetraspora silvatica]